MRKILFCSVAMAAVGLLAMAPQASATPLLPGTNGLPAVFTTPGATDTLLATSDDTVTSIGGAITAEIKAAVYRNASGFLDFYYQVVNAGTATQDALERMTNITFTNWDTDVFQSDTAFGIFSAPSASGTFVMADRNASGRTLGFYFTPFVGVAPGEASFIAKIATNATSYGTGLTTAQDGGVVSADTFDPVPEPSDLLLLGTGLLGLAGILRRRKANAL